MSRHKYPGCSATYSCNISELLKKIEIDEHMDEPSCDGGIEIDLNQTLERGFIFESDDAKFRFGMSSDGVRQFAAEDDRKFYDTIFSGGSYSGERLDMYRANSKMERITGDDTEFVYKRVVRAGEGPITRSPGIVAYVFTAMLEGFVEGSCNPFNMVDTQGPLRFTVEVCAEDGSWTGNILPGLLAAVATMQMRELSEFVLSPRYAFGQVGLSPLVPPGSSVLYSIMLMKCQPVYDRMAILAVCPGSDVATQAEKFTAAEIMSVATSLNELGNEALNDQSFRIAYARFAQASRLIQQDKMKINLSHSEAESVQNLLFDLHCNMSFVALKLQKGPPALMFAKFARSMQPKSKRVLLLLGKAYGMLGKEDLAIKYLKTASGF